MDKEGGGSNMLFMRILTLFPVSEIPNLYSLYHDRKYAEAPPLAPEPEDEPHYLPAVRHSLCLLLNHSFSPRATGSCADSARV